VVAVAGDVGANSTGSAQVAGLIATWAPDGVVLAGDNYYASVGAAPGARYDASIGRHYCAWLAGGTGGTFCPSGGSAPVNRLWAATGNHDYSDAGIAEYDAYFPTSGRYFATGAGDIDLFILDSEAMRTSATSLAEQSAWLQGALAAATRRWQVVVLHHPPYVTSVRGSHAELRLAYRAWGADLVISGHDHYYERLLADGLTYVVTGAGGASLSSFPTPPSTESVAHHDGAYGALRLASSDSALSGSYVTVDGATRDTFMIATPPASSLQGTPGAAPPPSGTPPAASPALWINGDLRLRRTRQGVNVRIPIRRTGSPAGPVRVALILRDGMGRVRVRAVRRVPLTADHLGLFLGNRARRALAGAGRVQATLVLTPTRGLRTRGQDQARIR